VDKAAMSSVVRKMTVDSFVNKWITICAQKKRTPVDPLLKAKLKIFYVFYLT